MTAPSIEYSPTDDRFHIVTDVGVIGPFDSIARAQLYLSEAGVEERTVAPHTFTGEKG